MTLPSIPNQQGIQRAFASFSDAALEAIIAPSWSTIGFAVRKRLEGWDANPLPRLDGRVVVLTGFTSGIGLAAATRLGKLGATLHLVGRNPDRVDATASALRDSGSIVHTSIADMGDLEAVRAIAAEITAQHASIDVLVHNAGALSPTYALSPQGIEMTIASQVLGPFLLTSLLLPALEAGESAGRVITIASGGMYSERLNVDTLVMTPDDYNGVRAYARAKRAQVELNAEWTRRCRTGVLFNAMHPGWVDTPGVEHSLPRFHAVTKPVLRSADAGADTLVWLAAADKGTIGVGGGFWLDRHRRSITKFPGTSAPAGERSRLWNWCEENSGSGPQPS
jgi:NAD(P)-dependent dehydrogenase (short-subunit alcohol dehydrogenase family)